MEISAASVHVTAPTPTPPTRLPRALNAARVQPYRAGQTAARPHQSDRDRDAAQRVRVRVEPRGERLRTSGRTGCGGCEDKFPGGLSGRSETMSDPEKSGNIPEECAGKAPGTPNGGNPAKSKEVRETETQQRGGLLSLSPRKAVKQ